MKRNMTFTAMPPQFPKKKIRYKMDISRRTVFKGLAATSALPLFNMGCAGFGASRARQIGGVFPLLWKLRG